MSTEIPVCQDHFRDHCRERVQGEPEASFGSGTESYGTPECFPYPSMSLPSSSPSLHYVVLMARSSDLSHLASRGTH